MNTAKKQFLMALLATAGLSGYATSVSKTSALAEPPVSAAGLRAAPKIFADALSNPNLCPNGSVILQASGGNATTSYTWSTGAVSPTINVSTPGDYFVTRILDGDVIYSNTITVAYDVAPVVTITQGSTSGFVQGGLVITANSNIPVEFQWINGPYGAANSVNASGTYTVAATTENGCTYNSTTSVNYVPANVLGSYVIIGKEEVELNNHVNVTSGGVGVTHCYGEAEFYGSSKVTGAGTFVRAHEIEVSCSSTVTTKYFTNLPSSVLPAFKYNPNCYSCTNSHHYYCCGGSSCTNSHHNVCSNNNKYVSSGSTVVIIDSILGNVTIGCGANVTFTSPRLYIKNMNIYSGAHVAFSQCTKVMVCNSVYMSGNVHFNLETVPGSGGGGGLPGLVSQSSTAKYLVTMYIGGSLSVNYGSLIEANIYALGEIHAYGSSCNPTYMSGLFIADEVEAENYVNFSSNPGLPCGDGYQYRMAHVDLKDEAGLINTYFETEMFPNPSATSFDLRLNSSSNTPATVQVFDLKGQLMESKVLSDTEFSFNLGNDYPSGVYIVKVTQDANTKVIRAIKTK